MVNNIAQRERQYSIKNRHENQRFDIIAEKRANSGGFLQPSRER